jgi:hypothetical protein
MHIRLPQKLDFVCQMLGVRPRRQLSVLKGTCGLKEAHNDADGWQNRVSGEVFYVLTFALSICSTSGYSIVRIIAVTSKEVLHAAVGFPWKKGQIDRLNQILKQAAVQLTTTKTTFS